MRLVVEHHPLFTALHVNGQMVGMVEGPLEARMSVPDERYATRFGRSCFGSTLQIGEWDV